MWMFLPMTGKMTVSLRELFSQPGTIENIDLLFRALPDFVLRL
jgi:hypothetical protein